MYENTENNNIVEKLEDCKYLSEIVEIINRTFPGWLVNAVESYSSDYDFLNKNWEAICQKLETHKKQIVLVNFISFEPQYSNLNKVCDYLTKSGYCVRRESEFTICEKCNKAIIVQEIYDNLKKQNIPFRIPHFWSKNCTSC